MRCKKTSHSSSCRHLTPFRVEYCSCQLFTDMTRLNNKLVRHVSDVEKSAFVSSERS